MKEETKKVTKPRKKRVTKPKEKKVTKPKPVVEEVKKPTRIVGTSNSEPKIIKEIIEKVIVEKNITVDDIMEAMFAKMFSSDIVNQLVSPSITDYERGKVAGKIEMLQMIAIELNPVKEEEEDSSDEDDLAGQKL